jgi:hypothetical protein
VASSSCGDGGRGQLSLTLLSPSGEPLATLRYTNDGSDRFRWIPDRFRLLVTSEGVAETEFSSLELNLPRHWRSVPIQEGEQRGWLVFPEGPPSFPVELRLDEHTGKTQRALAAFALPVRFCGRNRFDLQRDRLPWANRIDEFGPVEPSWDTFRRTFRLTIATRAFFRGLYREVVQLQCDADGGVRGGLCTGLARAALARALGRLPAVHDLRETVLVLHGRQLSDRALLAGLPWFLWPSPRRAYRAFVGDLLEQGWSERCFDLNVPRPWRRDLLQALLGQGHTVVPYAFCQEHADEAFVWVADPNYPDATSTVVTIDLARDRYAYPPLAVDGRRTTIVAVPLSAYLEGSTAILASLAGPLVTAPQRAVRTAGLALLVFLAGMAVVLLRRKR